MYKSKLFATAAAAAVLCASCSTENTEQLTILEHKAELTIRLTGDASGTEAGTKASFSAENEVKVNSVQILVFNENGSLDAFAGSSSSSGITLNCTTGPKEIFAVVNAPSLSSVHNKEGLMKTRSLLSDNNLTSFVMSGSIEYEITGAANVSVPVKRLVARVGIEKISADFKSEAYKDMDFRITGIYMINVAGDTDFSLQSEPSVWLNKMAYVPGEAEDLIYKDIADIPLTPENPYSAREYFYVYPNPTANDSHESSWSARYSRLIVETELGGTTYYYPISINGIEQNKKYTVTNLVITRPGSENPDKDITSEECTFSITVEDWEEGFSQDYTI